MWCSDVFLTTWNTCATFMNYLQNKIVAFTFLINFTHAWEEISNSLCEFTQFSKNLLPDLFSPPLTESHWMEFLNMFHQVPGWNMKLFFYHSSYLNDNLSKTASYSLLILSVSWLLSLLAAKSFWDFCGVGFFGVFLRCLVFKTDAIITGDRGF